MKIVDPGNFNHIEYAKFYCKQDVLVLKQGYEKFRSIIKQITSVAFPSNKFTSDNESLIVEQKKPLMILPKMEIIDYPEEFPNNLMENDELEYGYISSNFSESDDGDIVMKPLDITPDKFKNMTDRYQNFIINY